MGLIRRLDAWVGRTLFHPPIIAICHWTGQTQYALSSTLWFFAFAGMAYTATGWWRWVILAWVLVYMLRAGLMPDHPSTSILSVRCFWWAALAYDLLGIAGIGSGRASWLVIELFVLVAEYALTIRTLPPRPARERKTSVSEART
jgi:hypothetical protein